MWMIQKLSVEDLKIYLDEYFEKHTFDENDIKKIICICEKNEKKLSLLFQYKSFADHLKVLLKHAINNRNMPLLLKLFEHYGTNIDPKEILNEKEAVLAMKYIYSPTNDIFHSVFKFISEISEDDITEEHINVLRIMGSTYDAKDCIYAYLEAGRLQSLKLMQFFIEEMHIPVDVFVDRYQSNLLSILRSGNQYMDQGAGKLRCVNYLISKGAKFTKDDIKCVNNDKIKALLCGSGYLTYNASKTGKDKKYCVVLKIEDCDTDEVEVKIMYNDTLYGTLNLKQQ
jgi:hypothetical protein